ncbi:EAL domain-containing protein [Marinomonas sp. 5E14-1]|uniref:bifunctional diguanylate cyclase/phosphodiesterase n=1 Tax=Marinomonas sp. 5E14-1 TaxID=3153922 RepID=UPI0032632A95
MTFKSNILIFISVMLLVLLVGSFTLNISHTKAFLEKQLQSHSYDSANSLGLSLSTVADNPVSITTMIDAVFDRGHFSIIELVSMDGQLIYKRTNQISEPKIPSWFIALVDINVSPSLAVVQKGWSPIGELKVQSQKNYAYIELWLVFKTLVQWFLVAAVIFLNVAYFTIRVLLQPLNKTQEQAHAIVNKEYLLQDPLPSTTEFRRLAEAMNSMVSKLQQVFTREAQIVEKLRSIAYEDSVTGLYNRHYFDMTFTSIVDEEQASAQGSACLLRIDGLKELNTQYGYQLGNELVKHIAKQFHTTLNNHAGFYARLNGIELIALLPNTQPIELRDRVAKLLTYPRALQKELNLETMPISLTSAITRYEPNESKSNLFSQLDFLIQQAEAKHYEPVLLQKDNVDSTFNNNHWQKLIDSAITEQNFKLFKQEAYGLDESVYESELLVRMVTEDNKIQSAAYFMPAVKQLNMQSKIDELVLQLVTTHLQENNSNSYHSINLSEALLKDIQLFEKLLPQFKKAQGANLAFEFPETAVYENLTAAKSIFSTLRQMDFKVGIDRFGIQIADLQYLCDIHPDYIKLDASFSNQIESDASTSSYVISICEVTSNLDIDVFAMSIEKEAQLDAFKKAGVSYFQGYHFSTPTPL